MSVSVRPRLDDTPGQVAKAAFDALQGGRGKVTSTAKNKAKNEVKNTVTSAVVRALPEPLAAAAHRAFSKPGSAG